MRKILLGIVGLAFVASGCSVALTGRSASPAGAAPGGIPKGGAEPVAAVVRQALPAVVNVTTDVFQPGPFGNVQQGKGVGTGFIVRQDGIIVTNCHVVEGGSKITVSTSAQTPKQYDARVIGGDCQHDLAGHVEQRPARIAVVDRRVGLDHVRVHPAPFLHTSQLGSWTVIERLSAETIPAVTVGPPSRASA